MITFNELTVDEARELYDTYLVHTFPRDEVKPFKTIKELMEVGLYRCYSFYEGELLTGYAFSCEDAGHTVSLLDYYEIMESKRGQGYGQKIITLLGEIYKDYDYVILEAEDPDFSADDEDLSIRTRRIRFYEKCGLKDVGLRTNVFHVDYVVMAMACQSDPRLEEAKAKITSIYKAMIQEPYYTDMVHFK